MEKINTLELEVILNKFEKFNYDMCLDASLHARYKDVFFHKGFEACINSLKDYYKIQKNLDIFNAMRYL